MPPATTWREAGICGEGEGGGKVHRIKMFLIHVMAEGVNEKMQPNCSCLFTCPAQQWAAVRIQLSSGGMGIILGFWKILPERNLLY